VESYKGIPGEYYEDAHSSLGKSQAFHYNTREEYLLDFMGLKGNEVIADIGCGSGTFTRLIAGKYPLARITGIDLSQSAVEFAVRESGARGMKNVSFICSSVEGLSSDCGKFDVVIMSHIIEHLENPELCLSKVRGILKNNGKLFITTPNYLSLWPLAEIAFDRMVARKGYSLQEQHISPFNPFSLKAAAERTGFCVKEKKNLYLFSMPASLFSKRAAGLLFNIDRMLDFLPFGMITYMECEKTGAFQGRRP